MLKNLKAYLEGAWDDNTALEDTVYDIHTHRLDCKHEQRDTAVAFAVKRAPAMFSIPHLKWTRDSLAAIPEFMDDLANEMATERLRIRQRTSSALSDDALAVYSTLKWPVSAMIPDELDRETVERTTFLEPKRADAAPDELAKAKLTMKRKFKEDEDDWRTKLKEGHKTK